MTSRPKKYSDELQRRGVDEVIERGRKIPEMASQLGITSPETLRKWVRQAVADWDVRDAPTTEELAEMKALRKEVADRQRTIQAVNWERRPVGPASSGCLAAIRFLVCPQFPCRVWAAALLNDTRSDDVVGV